MKAPIPVFDIGGVTCCFRPQARLAALAEMTGLSHEEIQQAIWGSGLDRRCELGLFDQADAITAIREALGWRLDADDLVRAWSAAFECQRPS